MSRVLRDYGVPIRFVIGLVCLLLSSHDVAAIAAPVTLPLLWWAGWTSRNAAGRFLLNAVAICTAGRAATAAATFTYGENGWAALLLSLLAMGVVFLAYPLTQRRVPPPAYAVRG
jgi:hypothetical protein